MTIPVDLIMSWLPLATGIVGIGVGVLIGRATKKLKVERVTYLQKPPIERANSGISKKVRAILDK